LAEDGLPPFEKEVYDLLREVYYDIWYQIIAISKEEWTENGLRWPMDFMVRRSNRGSFFMFLAECLPGDTTNENIDERMKLAYARVCYNFHASRADSYLIVPDKLEIPKERHEAYRMAFRELKCTIMRKNAIPTLTDIWE